MQGIEAHMFPRAMNIWLDERVVHLVKVAITRQFYITS